MTGLGPDTLEDHNVAIPASGEVRPGAGGVYPELLPAVLVRQVRAEAAAIPAVKRHPVLANSATGVKLFDQAGRDLVLGRGFG